MNTMTNKHIAIVLAHPGDETTFAWPLLQDPEIKKTLVIVSGVSDGRNPRICAVRELCGSLKVPHTFMGQSRGFCNIHKDGTNNMQVVSKDVLKLVDSINADYIYTHNMLGENGDPDHLLVHWLLMNTNKSIICSDLTYNGNWIPLRDVSYNYKKRYFLKPIMDCKLTPDFELNCKQVFQRYGIWEMEAEMQKHCKVYQL